MIRDLVTADHQVLVQLTVLGPGGKSLDVEAIIDTGFDGWLSLPPAIIAELDLEWRERGRAFLADGSDCVFDIYACAVNWDGQLRRVLVHEAEAAPLVGM